MTKDTPTTSTATETVRLERPPVEDIRSEEIPMWLRWRVICTHDDGFLCQKRYDWMVNHFHSEQKALLERLRMEKESLPKNKCLNLETHKLGSCFSCEAIKGGNRKIDDFNAKIDAELEKL